MMNQDYLVKIFDLEKRITDLEKQNTELKTVVEQIKNPTLLENQDWDNATLLQEWHICERSAATYRKDGLEYYKRGGRVFYTPEARRSYLKKGRN